MSGSAGRALLDAFKAIDDRSESAAEHQRVIVENAELRTLVQELEAERDALRERVVDLEWNYAGILPGVVRRG